MSFLVQSLLRAFHITALIVILVLSLLLSLRLLGHSLIIRSFRLRPTSLSLFALKYSYKSKSQSSYPSLSVSSPHLRITLHLPHLSDPTILTLVVYNYDYADLEHCISLTNVKVVASLFPVLTRVSAGPFLAVTLHDFRIRVFSSEYTPQWIQRLRGNLVYTVLNGDTFRLDDLETNIVLSTIGGRATTDGDTDEARQATDIPTSFQDGSCSNDDTYNDVATKGTPCEEDRKPPAEDAGEEAIISLNSSQWYIQNIRYREYVFGTVAAQLRRSWDGERGSFVLIVKKSRWVQVARPSEAVWTKKAKPGWRDILWHIVVTPFILPSFLVRTIRDPGSSIDLYVPRADVTFDRFRLQDADLVRQGWGWIRKEYVERSGGDVIKDAIWKAILVFLN